MVKSRYSDKARAAAKELRERLEADLAAGKFLSAEEFNSDKNRKRNLRK